MRRNVTLSFPDGSLCRLILGTVIAMSGASVAHAQSSTNCITMGSGTMHCDTMDMSPPPATQPSYNTDAQGQPHSSAAAQMSNMIHAIRERSTNSKVGKMVTAGDCQAALEYALTKGRFDLANEVKVCVAAS